MGFTSFKCVKLFNNIGLGGGEAMQRWVTGLALACFSIVALVIVPASVSGSSPISNLSNAGFETGDLMGWTTVSAVDFVGVLGPDGYATSYLGDYVAPGHTQK